MQVVNRLKHRYSIYGFVQGLELYSCGAIKLIEQFLYIKNFFGMNFVPNLHHKDVSTVIEKDHLGDWSPEKDCC